ncbi:membrane protein [Dictyobacter sp. S3.2.2.5]|uniref:Membrane protein n=1 Tax=Dictyobacter halimunensis TaxID=3026934 RepID=A0ABQ6G3N3_9CHLR|nr:membrane protein [Dictyobacter sp. S3.2.2.5]
MSIFKSLKANPSNSSANTALLMRNLYFVRAAFALVWALGLLSLKTLPALVPILLILYPAFDAGSSLYDAYVHRASKNTLAQKTNGVISFLAVLAVLVVISMGVPAILRVFGVWAILTGAIELVTAIRRWKELRGQAALVFGGAVSILGGSSFIVLAGHSTSGLNSLAGYALMGSWQFLFSALRLIKQARQNTLTDLH